MRLRPLLYLAFMLLLLPLGAEQIEVDSFNPITPRRFGMGNSNMAIVTGAESLWTNPAALTAKRTEFNMISFGVTGLGDFSNLNDALPHLGNIGAMLSILESDIERTGTGFSMNPGLGWTGNGFGFGFYSDIDLFVSGAPYPAATEGYFDATLSVIGGYARSFPLTESLTLEAGATARPSLKYRTEADSSLIELYLSDRLAAERITEQRLRSPAWSVPLDLGARLIVLRDFTAALTFRDLFAEYYGGSSGNSYFTHWNMNAGIGWRPLTGDWRRFIEPSIAIELNNINRIAFDGYNIGEQLHAGLELALFRRTVTLLAGINQGHPTLGASLDLFIMDISIAWGALETVYGDTGNTVPVLTAELAFRLD